MQDGVGGNHVGVNGAAVEENGAEGDDVGVNGAEESDAEESGGENAEWDDDHVEETVVLDVRGQDVHVVASEFESH